MKAAISVNISICRLTSSIFAIGLENNQMIRTKIFKSPMK